MNTSFNLIITQINTISINSDRLLLFAVMNSVVHFNRRYYLLLVSITITPAAFLCEWPKSHDCTAPNENVRQKGAQ